MAESAFRVFCCTTDYILACSSSGHKLTLQAKSEMIKNGRPMPEIDLHSENGHGEQLFHMALYNKFLFLTASCKLNKLFCWPCLLFVNTGSILSESGLPGIDNITAHASSEKHLQCVLELGEFGGPHVELPDYQAHLDIKRHNEKVERNRNILQRLIDTTIFLGKQEMSFFDNGDEAGSSDNHGNFVESLLYLSSYDSVIETHLHSSSSSNIFSILSGSLQKDLISSIAEVMFIEIRSQILQSPFVSITIDSFPDINNCERLVTILRYCSVDNVEERFVGFDGIISAKMTAEVFSQHIFTVLERFSCLEKLVAQTYNGSTIMSSELQIGQEIVLQRCPFALFVPSSDQNLNVVLSRCVKDDHGCKTFFGHVKSLINFFNASDKRSSLLAEIINSNLMNSSDSTVDRWQYRSLDVNNIFANKQSIMNTFEFIQNDLLLWDADSLSFADIYKDKFLDFDFNFYLIIFSKIFTQAEILFKVIKSDTTSIQSLLHNIEKFKVWLVADFETSFDSLFSEVLESSSPPRKKRCYDGEVEEHYKEIFEAISIKTLKQINKRFEDLEKLKFLELLDCVNYDSFNKLFPNQQYLFLRQCFPDAFDWAMLKNELKAIYASNTFQKHNFSNLYEYFRMRKSLILESFSQTFKLCKLFLTIPAHLFAGDASCSVLTSVKKYCENTQNQHRFSELAIVAVEKNLLLKLKSSPTFYNDVLRQLAKKERMLDLEYK